MVHTEPFEDRPSDGSGRFRSPIPGPGACFAGRADAVCMFDLLYILHRQKSSGTLHVQVQDIPAHIAWINGQLVYVVFGDLTGMKALTRLVLAGPCSWLAAPNDDSIVPNLHRDTAEVLHIIRSVLADYDGSTIAQMLTLQPIAVPTQMQHTETEPAIATAAVDTDRYTKSDSDNDNSQPLLVEVPEDGADRSATLNMLDAILVEGESSEDPEATIAFQSENNAGSGSICIPGYHPPKIGSKLGACLLEAEVGTGACSMVYRAQHTGLHIPVAVKVLLTGSQHYDREKRCTEHEAQLLARINHPHILRVFHYEAEGYYPHLVMEYIDGTDFSKLIQKKNRLSANDALPIIRQIADGLAWAQRNLSVIHCDIKPSNILISTNGSNKGHAKLADLGLARGITRHTDIEDFESDMTDLVAGTPAYIAPEQVKGGVNATDLRSDIYALGITLYQALAGRTPFEDDNPVRLMAKHISEIPPQLEELRPGLDERIYMLVHRMIAKAPQDRYQTYEHLISDLDALTHGAGPFGNHRKTSIWNSMLDKLLRRNATNDNDSLAG